MPYTKNLSLQLAAGVELATGGLESIATDRVVRFSSFSLGLAKIRTLWWRPIYDLFHCRAFQKQNFLEKLRGSTSYQIREGETLDYLLFSF